MHNKVGRPIKINILGWFFPIIDAILPYLGQYEKCIIKKYSGAHPVEDDPMVTFRLFRLQEPEAPFQNATSRDWQKAPSGSWGLSAAGLIIII